MRNASRITAVLGPTNTGKTHHAIETMLGFSTGMIGLPLRLLAREVYDRVVARTGPGAVALVTGEEKIIPGTARYWICTTEAMPPGVRVEFLAVDEIQLCGDFERGHVFTHRLLHARGTSQTMFMGAATVRGLIRALVPDAQFEEKKRFSQLSYAGQKKISRLPPRSAIVAFSADMVYSLAELVRRQRGGAAIVMGALSPRTRNAQVALFQSGEVDYLVATDAIGMGLNMEVDHVSFASVRKFDGFGYRNLTLAELGQVAGRAGRYMNDGTFGVTGNAGALDSETVERLENHVFDPLKVLQWRNHNLNFASVERLLASLGAWPKRDGLTRARPATDIEALRAVEGDEDIRRLVRGPADVERLWQVCQIPDYRNISGADHAGLVARVFRFVSTGNGKIDNDWFTRQLSYCDRTDGDIDTLSNRIAHTRTWTFIANRSGWIDDPAGWRERTREIEDKLSDALHERLTQRFIDRRTSVLMRRLRQRKEVMSSVEEDGAVMVEGEKAGSMKGLVFTPDVSEGAAGKTLGAASRSAVEAELAARVQSIIAAPDPDLDIDASGAVIWQHAPVGQLECGSSVLAPRVRLIADDAMSSTDREAVQFRLDKFVSRHIASVLAPLQSLKDDETLDGLAKGIAFQLVENLGVIRRADIADDVKALDQEARGKLRRHGVRFGAFHIFVPLLLKPAATQLRLLLWALQKQEKDGLDRTGLPQPPGQGLTSVVPEMNAPDGFYRVAGYGECGTRVVRIDMLERLADMIRERVFWRPVSEAQKRPEGSVEGGGFSVIADMMSLVGCSGDEFSAILKSLGFRVERRVIAGGKSANTTEPETPKAETSDAGVASPEGEAKEKEDDAAGAEAEESGPEILEVWWPKDTGPFKTKKPARKASRQRPAAKSQRGKHPKAKAVSGKKGKPRPAPADSPFAVLQGLKASLEKKP